MSSLDSAKVVSCESVHWKVASLGGNYFKGPKTTLNFDKILQGN